MHVAAGCDDGSARVFEVDAVAGELRYYRTTPRVEGRVLVREGGTLGCSLATQPPVTRAGGWDVPWQQPQPFISTRRAQSVAWHPSAYLLVAGTSEGAVHSFDPSKQRELLRMTVGGATREGAAAVWAVAALATGEVVTGDSHGRVRWFDGATGAQTASLGVHAADVLALAASRDGRSVVAAGVDHQVALFR